MSAVEVLAIIDDVIAEMGDLPGTQGHELAKARAAVAELIEAAKEKQRVTGGGAVCTVAESNAVYRRMDAALANVTGGAA